MSVFFKQSPDKTKPKEQKPGTLVCDMVLTHKPVTYDVPLDKVLLGEILTAACSKDQTVRLTFRGIMPPGNLAHGFSVFLNNPEANKNTLITDPHYVDSVEFQTNVSVETPQSVALDLKDTIKRLSDRLSADKPLRITLVPLGDSIPDSLRVPFSEIEITVVKSLRK